MRRICKFVTMAGLSLALLTLGVAGAKAQSLSKTLFHGSINLPTRAQWGPMTLPAGQYNLYYGPLEQFGINVVEVISKTKGGPQTFILTKGQEQTSAKKSSLICMRDEYGLVIRSLEMSTLGKSVSFAMPHSAAILAQKQNGKYMAAKEQIQRISVNMDRK